MMLLKLLTTALTIIFANSLCLANINEKAEVLTAFCDLNNEQSIGANAMKRIIYKTGEKINGLIYLKDVDPYVRKSGATDRRALFQCECGNQFEATINTVRKGNTQSCGCLQKKVSSKKLITHGFSQLPIYKVWKNMKRRCYNKNHKSFKDYGGRGIKVYPEWMDNPEAFVKWSFNNGYKKGLQLDRINNDANYSPDNCRFVTPKVNTRNRRSTKIRITDLRKIHKTKLDNPEIKSTEIAKVYDVHPSTIRKILKRKIVV